MNSTEQLLKKCVHIINDWDLLSADGPEEDTKDIFEILVKSASAVGIDPNELSSVRAMLGDGWKLELKEK